MTLLKTLTGALALSVLAIAPAAAQYPDHAINLIVPWAAGGGTDATGRIIATLLGHYDRGPHAQLLFGLPQTSHQAVAPVVIARGCFKQQCNAQRTLGLAFIRVGGGATGYG